MRRVVHCLLVSIVLASPLGATDDHLILTEAVVTPTSGEYIEIGNPTAIPVALDDYYLTDDEDYMFLPGLTGGGPAPSIGSSDFIARFPAGAVIAPQQVVVIAFDGGGFLNNYGFRADYEIFSTDDLTPDMIPTLVGLSAGLTNSGENACLFTWDGVGDLVQDVDMVNLGTPSATNDIGDKSGVAVDGPDADAVASTYAPDAATMPQQAADPGFGFSTKRLTLEAGAELTGGGNGLTGDDETSEDILVTWDTAFTAPSPGCWEPWGCVTVETFEAGIDLWTATSASVEFGGASPLAPIPPDFFAPGSDPFVGTVPLVGVPLDIVGGPDLVPTDTILRRTAAFDLTDAPSDATVPVEIVALRLASTSPIAVTTAGVVSLYDVEVVLSDSPQPVGSLNVNRNCVDGGTFFADIPVLTKWIFTPVAGGPSVTLDFGIAGAPAITFSTLAGHWTRNDYEAPLGIVGPAPAGLEVDANLDGTLDGPLPASTANFKVGVELTPCDATTGPGDSAQAIVDNCFTAGGASICLQPPVAPPPLCPPLTDLVASSDCTSGDITLSWIPGGLYVTYEILRDGVSIATIAGDGDPFYVDAAVASGVHSYTVVGSCGASSAEVTTSLFHCPEIAIEEIRIDQPGGDADEYFELSGPPGQALDGLFYIVIGDGVGGSGVVEAVIDLAGSVVSPSGLFLAAEDPDTLGVLADLITTINFENSDNVTHMLVTDFTGAEGDDLDVDDDETLDIEPWGAVVDCIALVEDLAAGELVYCSTQLGPDGIFVPAHPVHCADGWGFGGFDPLAGGDTPGSVNPCTDCDANGVSDIVEISAGTALDCNDNGLPDACDIAAGTSEDCDADGVPDECQADCNGNGVPDSCDLAAGTSGDCNGNGVPDECDIADGTSLDVDGDGVPDECATAPGFTRGDCNADGAFDIGDAIFALAELFSGGLPAPCDDSCDVNDDGAKDIGDAIYALAALFSGGASPPAPFPACGVDPTDTDALDCADFAACP